MDATKTADGERPARPAKHSVELGPVPETLLIPLYARAVESARRDPLLRDPTAAEIVATLDYDFEKFDRKPTLFGACLRAARFDDWVRRFLQQHPAGTVVEVGAGLDTRFERVDNGRVRWFDLDLPEAIALRHRFFADGPRRTTIAASVLDESWIETIKRDSTGPYFFVAEAVLIYLTEPQVKATLALAARHFPGSWFAFDTGGRAMVDRQDKHDVMRFMQARFAWACDDPREIERWHPAYRLEEMRVLMDLTPAERRHLPPRLRLAYPILRLLPPLRRMIRAYRLNRFRLGAG